jgi:hypothetical protein
MINPNIRLVLGAFILAIAVGLPVASMNGMGPSGGMIVGCLVWIGLLLTFYRDDY